MTWVRYDIDIAREKPGSSRLFVPLPQRQKREQHRLPGFLRLCSYAAASGGLRFLKPAKYPRTACSPLFHHPCLPTFAISVSRLASTASICGLVEERAWERREAFLVQTRGNHAGD